MNARKLHAIAISTCLLLFPILAYAQTTSGNIQSVFVDAGGVVRISLVGHPALCSYAPLGSISYGEIRVGTSGVTAEGARSMLEVLSTAKLAGSHVRIEANNGTAGSPYGCSIHSVELLD